MADDKLPAYRNPETGLLRCPINEFKDCVQEKCFFWMDAGAADHLWDELGRRPHERDRLPHRGTCMLFIGAVSVPILSHSAGDWLDENYRTGQGVDPRKYPKDLPLTLPNVFHRLLRDISAKLDSLLKKRDNATR